MNKFLFIIFLLFSDSLIAATYWVSPTGSAEWNSCVGESPISGSSACSLATGISSAVAGDLVYLRAGTYSGTTWTINSASGISDNNRIIFRAYTGETPILSGDGRWIVEVRRNWIWIDGLTIEGPVGGADSFVIGTYNSSVTGLKITNCTLTMAGATGADNVAAIGLFAAPSGTYIKDNTITGFTTETNQSGIITFGVTGTIILNNNISNFGYGMYLKHPNCDTSAGAEIAYNYVIAGNQAIRGRGKYLNLHDNIFRSSNLAWLWGDEGGDVCAATDDYMTFNHNTFFGNMTFSGTDHVINAPSDVKNNIITGTHWWAGGTGIGTWTYNLLSWTQTGSNNINGSPTFVGGADPSTIAGYALATGSSGENNSDDSTDRGANVSLVGVNAGLPSLTVPTLSSPSTSATGQALNVSLSWSDTNTSPNESHYYVRIKAGAGAYQYYQVAADEEGVSAATAFGSSLSNSTTYSWSVQAHGDGSTTSDSAWPTDYTFQTLAVSGDASVGRARMKR